MRSETTIRVRAGRGGTAQSATQGNMCGDESRLWSAAACRRSDARKAEERSLPPRRASSGLRSGLARDDTVKYMSGAGRRDGLPSNCAGHGMPCPYEECGSNQLPLALPREKLTRQCEQGRKRRKSLEIKGGGKVYPSINNGVCGPNGRPFCFLTLQAYELISSSGSSSWVAAAVTGAADATGMGLGSTIGVAALAAPLALAAPGCDSRNSPRPNCRLPGLVE